MLQTYNASLESQTGKGRGKERERQTETFSVLPSTAKRLQPAKEQNVKVDEFEATKTDQEESEYDLNPSLSSYITLGQGDNNSIIMIS